MNDARLIMRKWLKRAAAHIESEMGAEPNEYKQAVDCIMSALHEVLDEEGVPQAGPGVDD